MNKFLILPILGLHMVVQGCPEREALAIVENGVKAPGPFQVERLTGGLSGSTLIRVTTETQDYVVRFWNRQWADFFPQEYACQVIASEAAYGPKLFFADEAACITVMEYFHPEPLPDTSVKLEALALLLKKIHSGPQIPSGIDKVKDLGDSIEEFAHLPFLDIATIRKVKEEVFATTRPSALTVACHRDLNPSNLIFSEGRFVAVDYTWGGMDDPFVDLATVAIFNCTSLEEEKLLLEYYLGHPPTNKECARLSLMKLTSKLFYGLELLRLIPQDVISSSSPSQFPPKRYLHFGQHGKVHAPSDLFEYAASFLSEVIEEARHPKYAQDLLEVLYPVSG